METLWGIRMTRRPSAGMRSAGVSSWQLRAEPGSKQSSAAAHASKADLRGECKQGQQTPQQPIIIAQQFAPTAPVVVYNSSTNHGLHLLLTVLTCGLWLPVWIIAAIVNGGR